MTSSENRFQLVKSNTITTVEMIDQMSEMGVFSSYEIKACAAVLSSMVRAMTILDPEQTKTFIQSYLSGSSGSASLFQEAQTDNIGQYL